MNQYDRCKGALYGLAIGDALGAAVEFRYPGEFAPVTGYRDGGPHGLAAGQWTDDTSMAKDRGILDKWKELAEKTNLPLCMRYKLGGLSNSY